MPILPSADLVKAELLSRFGYTNPFQAQRVEMEKQILGRRFVGSAPRIQYQPASSIHEMFPNAVQLRQLSEELLDRMRQKLLASYDANETERVIYRDLGMYVLYARYISKIVDLQVDPAGARVQHDIAKSFSEFSKSFDHYFAIPGQRIPALLDVQVVFAGLFQIERAFFHVFRYIVGGTQVAAKLRASVWESIFTCDMRRYSQGLYRVMVEIPTLITGPSGTGKELVARAIAYSRYIDFDPKSKRFVADFTKSFHGLNLSALPAELIESELYGHVKGAFTGASRDRAGIFDEGVCGPCDTVFLDEIGELDERIQVKLLRVLQEREFQRVGDVELKRFTGKLVAATNRDVAAEMSEGRFREDFYYRLCADRITTPSLKDQLQESPEDLINFVRFISRQLFVEMEDEIESLTTTAIQWIDQNLGEDYPWPGNIRELEQCVRSVMIRGNYSPPTSIRPQNDRGESQSSFMNAVLEGQLTRDELMQAYCKIVYDRSSGFKDAGARLGIDWRTVRRYVQGEGPKEGPTVQ